MAFKSTLVAELVFLFVSLPSVVIGDCPKNLPSWKNDVNMEKFRGMWYEYAASTREFPYLFADAGCVPLVFHNVSRPSCDYIYYKNVTTDDTLKTIASLHGSGGDYKIQYFKAKQYIRGSFLILDTDYKCWAVVYACVKSEPVYVSILQRLNDGKMCFDDKAETAVGPALQKADVRLSDMDKNKLGNNCEYTPESYELMN